MDGDIIRYGRKNGKYCDTSLSFRGEDRAIYVGKVGFG